MPFELQSSYFFYITQLLNNTSVKNRKVEDCKGERGNCTVSPADMVPVSVWVSSKTDSETRLWVQGVYLRGDPRECVAPFIVWGKFARHKALEANGDATVGESGVTQANQPREGADYVDKGPANVPCWPHGSRHQVYGLKISPKCSSGSAQGSQGGLDKRFQQ